MKIREFIKRLEEDYNLEDEMVAVIWLKDDVSYRATDQGKEITDEQVSQVIHAMERNHDACIGINWDVIDFHIDDVLKDETS